MRDIATVTPGEHVTVAYNGGDTLKGVYRGIENGVAVVDYTFGIASIDVDSRRIRDADGNVLGESPRCSHGCLQGRCGYQTCPSSDPQRE